MDTKRLRFKDEIAVDVNYENLLAALKKNKSKHVEKNKLSSKLIDLDFVFTPLLSSQSLYSNKIFNIRIESIPGDTKSCLFTVQIPPGYLLLATFFISGIMGFFVHQLKIELFTGFAIWFVFLLINYFYL